MPRLSLKAKPFLFGQVYILINITPLHSMSRLVDMIIIEKTGSMDFPFVLRVGDLQHPLIADELMQLRCCLENCRDENAPVPKSRCKLLPPWHSPPEEQERDVKRVRATLWVGEKRWRISKAEEEDLLLVVRRLMSEGHAGDVG